ncbi:hypothetical protein CLOSTHATH_03873 [Hungatella hathewayi DSM 13479]|uniref:Uncharacterized protein n=1 Tax=Hungatella hathewayi DSM 13479 TaxID=566550 RepID=D3AJT0_9FIRM|nr:hypothetical protein CLOSTHATH_03873 [Hungatella hathewayi DSM 13479]
MQNIIKYCTVALLKHRYNRNGKTAGVQHFSDFGELGSLSVSLSESGG